MASPDANWHPDPSGRHELRYWDGTRWTEHVADGGRQATDPPTAGSPVPAVGRATEKVTRDVARAGTSATSCSRT